MATATAADVAKKEMERARAQVLECEKEIQKIKTSLRGIGTDEGAPNSLEISATKVTGLPDEAKPNFVLQLSSPVEEFTLNKLWDEADPEGSKAVFSQVETSVATLTVEAKDAEKSLGSSAPHDVAPLCKIEAMDPKPQYVSELGVAIVAEGISVKESESESFQDAVSEEGETEEPKAEGGEETKKEETEGVEETKEGDVNEDAVQEAKEKQETKSPAIITPLCTVTLRVTYKPSAKDLREELYDLLNKASQRKNQAIENLRRSATAVSRATSTSTAVTTQRASPAVQAGFLNKPKKDEHRVVKLYERWLGPNSFIRQVFPIAKNFVIFFGMTAFFHFKGHLLALPPPV